VYLLVNNFQNNTCFENLTSTFIEQLRKSWRVSVRLAPFKIYNSNHKYVYIVVCTHTDAHADDHQQQQVINLYTRNFGLFLFMRKV